MATGREEEVGVEVEGEAAAEVEEEDGIETVPEIDRVIEKKGVYLFFFSLPSFFFFFIMYIPHGSVLFTFFFTHKQTK